MRTKTSRGPRTADEVIALLAATTQATLRSAWSPTLQQRTLAIIFAGLRSPTTS
jgi:hypothetical protein